MNAKEGSIMMKLLIILQIFVSSVAFAKGNFPENFAQLYVYGENPPEDSVQLYGENLPENVAQLYGVWERECYTEDPDKYPSKRYTISRILFRQDNTATYSTDVYSDENCKGFYRSHSKWRTVVFNLKTTPFPEEDGTVFEIYSRLRNGYHQCRRQYEKLNFREKNDSVGAKHFFRAEVYFRPEIIPFILCWRYLEEEKWNPNVPEKYKGQPAHFREDAKPFVFKGATKEAFARFDREFVASHKSLEEQAQYELKTATIVISN